MTLFNNTNRTAIPVPGVVETPYGLYPAPDAFSNEYDAEDYRDWVEQSNGDPLPAPLALYIQDIAPVTGDGSDIPTSHRLSAIEKELDLQGVLFDSDRSVQQFICSGNIVTEWTDDQLYKLISVLQDFFQVSQQELSSWCACSGHTIPSETRLRLLRVLGFSSIRFSFNGRADKPGVLEEVRSTIETARRFGIQKVILDIILNDQKVVTVSEGLEKLLSEVSPDRVRLMGGHGDQHRLYARILSSIGYQNIGLNWFLRSDDIWLQAKSAGLLQWSLLGFTDMQSPDVIGVGPGALSSIGDFYGANESRWRAYQECLERGVLPVVSGIELEADDVLRREIMRRILSGSCIRISALEDKWGIRFKQFFDYETAQLMEFQRRGWIDWRADRICIKAKGYQELTELCRVFDHRARAQMSPPSLSIV